MPPLFCLLNASMPSSRRKQKKLASCIHSFTHHVNYMRFVPIISLYRLKQFFVCTVSSGLEAKDKKAERNLSKLNTIPMYQLFDILCHLLFTRSGFPLQRLRG